MYIDKRALATKKSSTSLIPYISLDNIINKIISRKVASIFSQSSVLDQIGAGDWYSSIIGNAKDSSALMANVQIPLPNCAIRKFGVYIPSGGNLLDTDVVEVLLIVDGVEVASFVIDTDGSDGFISSEDLNIVVTENQLVNYLFAVSSGTGTCSINSCRLDYSIN